MTSIFLALLVFVSQEAKIAEGLSSGKYPQTPSPLQLENGAIGILDMGQLSTVTTNWGVVAPTPMTFTPALHWPANGPFQQQYSYGNYIFVAKDGNVATVHNWLAELVSDWTPVKFHSGDVTNPDGWPFLASSDDPRTWPNGIWPGPYRIDPYTGQEVQGEFTSDKDIYAVYNDSNNPNGPIGVEIHQVAYSYGAAYGEDLLVFRFFLFNTTPDTLYDLHFGIKSYLLVDFDEGNYQDLIFFKDANPLDEDTARNFVYWVDYNGVAEPPWESNGPMGIAVLRTPYDLGITDFHWYKRTLDLFSDSTLWPVIVSDTSTDVINPDWYFHGGTNYRIDQTPPPEPERYIAVISTGPFNLPPNDSVEFAIAYVAGEDTFDLFENAKTAFKLETFEFQGPKPPPPPTITVIPGDGYVKIYWSREPSETTPDPFTQELDFEGYRIYRSTDFGQTWGDPITDYQGNIVGYKPIAIFDLDDGIYGPDPVNPYFDRGSDNGIRYSFVDSSVINGLTYWYMVTAYDRGNPDSLLPALESPYGTPANPHVDSVIPGPPPGNINPGNIVGDSLLRPAEGWSTAEVRVSVVNPVEVTGHTYRLEFDSLADTLIYSVIDKDINTIKLGPYPLLDSVATGLPIFDGLRIFLANVDYDVAPPTWTLVHGDTCNYQWQAGDSITIFGGKGTFLIKVDRNNFTEAIGARPAGLFDPYPYQETDTVFLLPFQAYYIPPTGDTLPVDKVLLLEFNLYYNWPGIFSPMGWDWEPGGAAWTPNNQAAQTSSDQIGLFKYEIANGDTIDSNFVFIKTENGPDSTGIPPSDGDIIEIKINVPLSPDVAYEFETVKQSFNQSIDLSRVKVVPNPLIVVSGFERKEGESRIMFTNLPSKCKIYIYNIAGEHIKTIDHNNGLSYEYWDLRTKYGLQVAYGLYIYAVEAPDGSKKVGKFAIVR